MKHEVIGQGTYGCIHKESLRCDDNALNMKEIVYFKQNQDVVKIYWIP